jgi:ATPase family associated with various cellular activities (AAA)
MRTPGTTRGAADLIPAETRKVGERVEVLFDEPLTVVLFRRLAIDRGARHLRHLEWTTDARDGDVQGLTVLASSESEEWRRWLFDLDDVLVRLHVRSDGSAWGSLAAADPGALELAGEKLLHRFPREVVDQGDSAGRVPITFWSESLSAPRKTVRRLCLPSWNEVRDNYPGGTRAQLSALMNDFSPGEGGQLILWHGPPGTGKTFAIRALARRWRDWCDVHFVTDPETFLGARPEYMLNVLMGNSGWDAVDEPADGLGWGESPQESLAPHARWRLIVMEDTGELVQPDAKTVAGQALSRLLNLVDGMLGEGLRLLVLITTNEVTRVWHPATHRPGRCAASVEFAALSADEARGWLSARGKPMALEVGATIAELYAVLAGVPGFAPTKQVGFA